MVEDKSESTVDLAREGGGSGSGPAAMAPCMSSKCRQTGQTPEILGTAPVFAPGTSLHRIRNGDDHMQPGTRAPLLTLKGRHVVSCSSGVCCTHQRRCTSGWVGWLRMRLSSRTRDGTYGPSTSEQLLLIPDGTNMARQASRVTRMQHAIPLGCMHAHPKRPRHAAWQCAPRVRSPAAANCLPGRRYPTVDWWRIRCCSRHRCRRRHVACCVPSGCIASAIAVAPSRRLWQRPRRLSACPPARTLRTYPYIHTYSTFTASLRPPPTLYLLPFLSQKPASPYMHTYIILDRSTE